MTSFSGALVAPSVLRLLISIQRYYQRVEPSRNILILLAHWLSSGGGMIPSSFIHGAVVVIFSEAIIFCFAYQMRLGNAAQKRTARVILASLAFNTALLLTSEASFLNSCMRSFQSSSSNR